MSSRTRRTVVVFLGLAGLTTLAYLAPLAAQQPGQPIRRAAFPGGVILNTMPTDDSSEETSQSIQLPTDARQKKKLDAARDYIKEQSWGEASRILQSLLDADQDSFVAVPGKDAAGKPTRTDVSVRVQAQQLLSTFPPAGLEHYRLSYGAAARDLLNRAKADGSAELLAQVWKRYLYTEAGHEALRLLATHQLDHREYVPAALRFKDLRNLPGSEQLPPATLVQAAFAFHRAAEREGPDTAKQYQELEQEVWKELTERVGTSVRLGDRTLALRDLRAEINRGRGLDLLVKDSAANVFAGNPSRTHQGVGDKPFMDKSYSYPTAQVDQTIGLLDQAVRQAESHGQPVLPAFFPVAADGLVMYRDFWGIHGRDAKTGALRWESDSRYGYDRMLDPRDGGNKTPYLNNWAQQYLSMGKSAILYENTVVGTLSTDGNHVYAVEDLYLPPVGQAMPWAGGMGMPGGRNAGYGPLTDAVYANRLNAYSVRTGKLLWEIGCPGDTDDPKSETDQGESYFLGPPLPLHGRLYVLTEKNQDLRLLCLDPDNGAVHWSQLLATTQTRLSQDVNRRVQAAHLAYGEGILVCPTNAGMLLGVDLLSHTVVWAHPYREKGQAPPMDHLQQQQLMMMRRGLPVQNFNPGPNTPEWKVTAPVVQDGRVVFTAPDGASVRCLNLPDGSLVWKAPRTDDDLYLGAVVHEKVLIVGKKECRALSMANGTALWTAPTGVPSGQGVATDRVYYLPLKEGREHEPEVCVLDLDTGKLTHTKSRKKEVPGNLVLYEGNVLSETLSEVAAYPQLKTKLRQMEERIARNPQDPVGLTERGELRLDDGDLAGAVRDLRQALHNNPPPDTRAKARAQLYDALTDYLKDRFNDAEPYLADYKELCQVEVGPEGTAEDKQKAEAEQLRRTGNYLSLVARGREKQGRLTEAFQLYLDFAALPGRKGDKERELVSVPDEASVKAPATVWARGRISALLAKADARQRDELERLITRRWEDLKGTTDTDALRGFVAVFGSEFKVGREARFALAERLMEENGKTSVLEAERQLLLLARQPEDRTLAARAVEALARLMARAGLLEDAAHYYRVLGHDFADVEVRDGKTGADFLNDLATDKRFLPYLEEPGPAAGGGKVGVHIDQSAGSPPAQQLFHFEPAGEVLPFFRHLSVALEPQTHSLRLLDADGGDVGHASLTRTQFFTFLQQQGQSASGPGPRYAYHTVGHVIVLPVGHMVFGIDPLNKGEVLWERSLLGAQGQPSNGTHVVTDPKDDSVQIFYQDGFIQRLGQAGPALPGYVCLLTKDGLLALDPVTGETLWTRADGKSHGQVFGDDRRVYLVDMNAAGNPTGTHAFRAADGVTVPDVPDFGTAYQQRRTIDGHRLFCEESTNAGLTARLYEVPTGKDVWKRECPPGSVVVHCEDPHQGGVLQPDGSLTVLDLRSGKEVLQARLDPKDVDKVQGATLLQDHAQWYLAINGPRDAGAAPWGGPFSNFLPSTGYRSAPVNGKVYAFDRATGKMTWETIELPQQMLVLEQLRDLPFLLLTSRYTKVAGAGPNRWATPSAALSVVDKRTGKLVKDERDLSNAQQFHTLRIDLREGKIELVSFNLKVTIALRNGVATAEARGPQEAR
jgi:outer membrane protein assembly factor BamB